MTDRELLELAAKAAGYDVTIKEVGGCLVGERTVGSLGFIFWRPLQEDGDALRLAVACALRVEMGKCWNRNGVMFGEDIMQGEMKATRRAICRAAAEIGKGMK